MASDASELNNQLKEMEIAQGRGKMYHFHFIGTIETYEDILSLDTAEFREKILDLFDIPIIIIITILIIITISIMQKYKKILR